MKCVALWYGGCNYANPDPERDLETFDSLTSAAAVFEARASFDPYYPCVDDEATEMHIYFGTDYHEYEPDRIIKFGKRGGVNIGRA